MNVSLNTSTNIPEQKQYLEIEDKDHPESHTQPKEIDCLMERNLSVKRELARQLHNAGLTMKAIARILHLHNREE